MPDVDVIVVGAGNAGLSAAKKLKESGKSVLVLEAEQRVGGRSLSGRFSNKLWYNLGTQYIGGRGTPASLLADELGVKLRPIFEPKVAMYAKDRLIVADSVLKFALKLPFSIPAKLSMLRVALRLRKARKPMTELAGDERRKWRKETDSKPFSIYLENIHPDARHFYEDITLMMTGGPSDRVSAFLGLLFTEGIGEPRTQDRPEQEHLLAVEGGTAALPEAVARSLAGSVRMGAKVEEVRTDKDGVAVRSNGQTITARSCIVATMAPQVPSLVAHLPETVRRDLAQIEYGRFVSVAFHTRDKGRPRWSELFHIEAEGLSVNIFNNLTFYQPDAQNESVILGFAAGDRAAALLALSDKEIETKVSEDLFRIFPEARGTIVSAVVRRWPVALPYWRPGGDAVRSNLLKFGGPIYLAGDYLDYPNIQGAIRSGVRAAERVLSA